MRKVVVIGSSNTDMVVTSTRIPARGETVIGGDFLVIPGGKGANQAVAAARAGGQVIFIAKTGDDDFGRQAIEGYKKDGLITDHIFIDPQFPSGVAMIIVDEKSGDNSIVVAPGANHHLSIQDIEHIQNEITNSDVLLVQLEIPVDTVKKSLEIAKRAEVLTILDPAPAQDLSEDILGLVDIITPNETETKILTGIDPDDHANIKNAAGLLLSKINHTVIITLGERGAYYLSKDGNGGFIQSEKVKAIDTTAAGDVFNGYLASGLASGLTLVSAIEMAIKAATQSVTIKGAQTSIPILKNLV